MHSYAQTNLQLFNQLHNDGYSDIDIQCILDAYKLVMSLFTGCFRPSGKTFIAHLVGTASILSRLHVPVNVVAAGLLHAAYASGDFGDGIEGISQGKREQIRHVVGEEVEEYIARYTQLQWNEQTILAICDRFDALNAIDRNVLLIRLANELEEYLDLGILYCGDDKYQEYINHHRHTIVELAEKLGFPTLAVELATVFQETTLSKIPTNLSKQIEQSFSFLIVPLFYQKQLSIYQEQLSMTFYNRLSKKFRYLCSAIFSQLHRWRSGINIKKKLNFENHSE